MTRPRPIEPKLRTTSELLADAEQAIADLRRELQQTYNQLLALRLKHDLTLEAHAEVVQAYRRVIVDLTTPRGAS